MVCGAELFPDAWKHWDFLFSLYLVFMMEKRLSTVTPQLNKDIWQTDCNTKIPLEAAAGVERQSHWEPVGGIQLLVQT